MTAEKGMAICVGIFFATAVLMVAADVVLDWWRQGGRAVESAERQAREVELDAWLDETLRGGS